MRSQSLARSFHVTQISCQDRVTIVAAWISLLSTRFVKCNSRYYELLGVPWWIVSLLILHHILPLLIKRVFLVFGLFLSHPREVRLMVLFQNFVMLRLRFILVSTLHDNWLSMSRQVLKLIHKVTATDTYHISRLVLTLLVLYIYLVVELLKRLQRVSFWVSIQGHRHYLLN